MAAPFVPPLQLTAVTLVIDTDGPVGSLKITVVVPVHPFASRAVTKYVPEPNPVNVPIDWYAPPFKLYSILPVPPVPLAVISPAVPPEQSGSTFVALTLTAVAGSVIVTCAVAVQLFASLTVTV
jgi:hypothetical protein